MTVTSSAIRTPRIHVQYIFISKIDKKYRSYDLGFLDDDFNYYETTLNMHVDSITLHALAILNKIFKKYSITKETEIDILDTIEKTEPLYMYLTILNQQVFANIRFVSIDMIPRRIAAFHRTYLGYKTKPSSINRRHIEKLWKKLIEMEKCPWITESLDIKMRNMSVRKSKRQKIVRLGLYYAAVKRFLVSSYQYFRDKKKYKHSLNNLDL